MTEGGKPPVEIVGQASMEQVLFQITQGGTLVLECIPVRPEDLNGLLQDANKGDEDAALIAYVAMRTVANVQKAREAGAALPAKCMCCDQPILSSDFGVIVMLGFPRERPSRGFGIVICDDCATTPMAMLAKATEAMERLLPNSRTVTATGPGTSGTVH